MTRPMDSRFLPSLCAGCRRIPLLIFVMTLFSVLGTYLNGQEIDSSQEESWSRFRGVGGLGVLEFPADTAVRFPQEATWKAKLAGAGNGSPVIFQQRVFVQSADAKTATQFLHCFDLQTGAEVWTKHFVGETHATHAWGSLASSTPSVDSDRIYFCWGSPGHTHLAACTHEGKLVWQRDLGPNRFEHGFGSSPTLVDGRLIFFHSQDATDQELAPKFSRMLALDPKSGATIWETPLEKTTRVCYGVPVEVRLPTGKAGILAADTGHGIFCLDAETGKLLWEQPVIKQRAVSGAMAVGDMALASSGSGGGGNQLVAIRMSDQQEIYRMTRNANYVPMPVVVGQKLFVANDKGILSCCDLASGEVLQQQRLDERRFNISSSLVAFGSLLLVLSDEGQLKIVTADVDLKNLQTIELGEPTRATPALSPQGVVLRTDTQLHGFRITP
ncbi:MAG: PQQ-binding-like beta-propeller repeat protein [Planctomycetaceae bacterium]|nr:PQQ-binding-like beta-propeller repeat protein [Planctomycetaceae bacterium]